MVVEITGLMSIGQCLNKQSPFNDLKVYLKHEFLTNMWL